MGIIGSLTTAYHPHADGQTEVLNQSLQISLCAYVSPNRNDWVNYLDALALSYNKVEMIIANQRKKGRKGRYVVEYLTRLKGYNADLYKWLNSRQLRNAPEVLKVWHKKPKPPGSHSM